MATLPLPGPLKSAVAPEPGTAVFQLAGSAQAVLAVPVHVCVWPRTGAAVPNPNKASSARARGRGLYTATLRPGESYQRTEDSRKYLSGVEGMPCHPRMQASNWE